MKEGDIVLTPLPQANGQSKNRPALFLRAMPPFDDALVCGISTQLHQQVAGFDEVITQQDAAWFSGADSAPATHRQHRFNKFSAAQTPIENSE